MVKALSSSPAHPILAGNDDEVMGGGALLGERGGGQMTEVDG